MMVYYGHVNENIDFKKVYNVLQGALKQIPELKPYRGPEKYIEENLEYNNLFEGEINDFFGTEIIKSSTGEIIYTAKYIGGLIDQNR